MENEAGQSVEETQQEEVAEEPVEESAQEERRPRIKAGLQAALVGSRRAGVVRRHRLKTRAKRRDLGVGKAIVLVDPEREALVVLVDDVVVEPGNLAAQDQHVLVHGAVFAARIAAAPEAQQPGRIVAAMADPAAPEEDAALDHQSGDVWGKSRKLVRQFALELVGQA